MAHAAIQIDDVTKIFKLYREKAKSAKERVIRAGRNPYTPFYALTGPFPLQMSIVQEPVTQRLLAWKIAENSLTRIGLGIS